MRRLAFLVMFVFVFSGVFADISISEPLDVYNLGDRLYVDLGELRGIDNGNLDINLVCGNNSVNMVRIPGRAFSSDEDQVYSIPYKVLNWEDLGIIDLGDIVGKCQVVASLGGEITSSKIFDVTDRITVDASFDKFEYNPGEAVTVSINAIKSNSVAVNGFVDGSNASSFSKTVEDGLAESVFNVPDTAEAGNYNLKIHVYDVGSMGVLNSGNKVISYVVNQVPTSLILSLSDVAAVPGNNFSIGAEIFDQSGVEINGNIMIDIISPEGDSIKSMIQGGEFALVDFESNSSVGTWKIISQFDELIEEREFEMMPLQKVDFDFEDSVLVVKNVGNVLYNKTINVNIGDEVMVLNLKMKAGDVRKFSLKAPMGKYDIVVGDGEHEVSRNVMLTGNAISVSDFRGAGFFKSYSIIWIFLIIILGGIGGVLFMRYRKTKVLGKKESFFDRLMNKIKGNKSSRALHDVGSALKKNVGSKVPDKVKSNMSESLNFTKKSPVVQSLDTKNYSHKDKSMVDFTDKSGFRAESALVMKGDKHMSSVVALSVKNHGEGLSDVARQGLMDILENSKGKGLIDDRNDFIFIVFSPLVTRTYKNESLAVRCAMKVLENLTVYNKKFKDKVEFGIGVHAGEMVASKEKGKLKYTGIGNTISFAKRMSGVDSSKVVVSDVVRKKLLSELKVVKGKSIGESLTYVVNEVKDKSGDAIRLKELMKRQG